MKKVRAEPMEFRSVGFVLLLLLPYILLVAFAGLLLPLFQGNEVKARETGVQSIRAHGE